jgi:hypothetical protein
MKNKKCDSRPYEVGPAMILPTEGFGKNSSALATIVVGVHASNTGDFALGRPADGPILPILRPRRLVIRLAIGHSAAVEEISQSTTGGGEYAFYADGRSRSCSCRHQPSKPTDASGDCGYKYAMLWPKKATAVAPATVTAASSL